MARTTISDQLWWFQVAIGPRPRDWSNHPSPWIYHSPWYRTCNWGWIRRFLWRWILEGVVGPNLTGWDLSFIHVIPNTCHSHHSGWDGSTRENERGLASYFEVPWILLHSLAWRGETFLRTTNRGKGTTNCLKLWVTVVCGIVICNLVQLTVVSHYEPFFATNNSVLFIPDLSNSFFTPKIIYTPHLIEHLPYR